ncbi:hypothetical protein F4778DRAFT_789104 [Xylariomycetidae sp. FL2044]|nr:hypothetical protein F4778DRAFT_789104 [Xylariomycetidae sp. FL2044]
MDSSVDINSNEPDNHNYPPPIDEDILNGRPPTAWHDFKHAKLRQFPVPATQIEWLEYLGHGEQGIVFKATAGNSDPVAVKVFWRTRQPIYRHPRGFRLIDWPFKDESRTVALLEKLRWVMSDMQANAAVKIVEGPKTSRDAFRNLHAFSDEGRQSPRTSTRHQLTGPPPFPPLPACYGWMKIPRESLPRLDRPVWKEVDDDLDWHWAIVYELVPGATQDLAVGQMHLDFFYAIGFAMEAYKPDNWHGGRLVDLNDICSPFCRGWRAGSVYPREATTWFWTLDYTRGPAIPRTIIRPRVKKLSEKVDLEKPDS